VKSAGLTAFSSNSRFPLLRRNHLG
jgi:hypothetical protein